jgi:hypothetical protein
MTMIYQSKYVLAILLLAFCANVQADATVEFANTGDGKGKAAGAVQISNGRVRSSSPGESSAYMIFDAAANQFTMIDVERKTYMVFDQQQIQDLVEMQKKAMQQMEAALANMPESQRAQMRKMMSGMMGGMQGGAKPEPHRYVRNGKTDNVAGHDCEILEVYAGDNKVAEQCVVGQAQLGIPADDYQTMKAMQEFIIQLVSQFPMVNEQIMEYGEPGHDEIPVRYSHFSKMTGTTQGALRNISFDAIDASRFEIPKGFKQQKMPKM